MEDISLVRPAGIGDWRRIRRLYRAAFPAAERKPFSLIVRMSRKGRMDTWCVRKNGDFLGLAITINGDDLILLDYLAVAEAYRGRGVGEAALAALRRHYAGRDVFLEIESVYEDVPDRELRLRRKQFYLRCGLTPMGVMVRLFGVKMELLGFDCRIGFARYREFYRENLGDWAAERIGSECHPEATDRE